MLHTHGPEYKSLCMKRIRARVSTAFRGGSSILSINMKGNDDDEEEDSEDC